MIINKINPIVHPPQAIRKALRKYHWKIKTDLPVIFLTFDDGPTPQLTTWILQTLKKYNAKATFFCVGNNVRKYPELYKSILANGHSTGNHTYSHKKGLKTDNKTYFEDIAKANFYIKSDLFRPPHGRMKASQSKIIAKNMKIILWDVLSKDYDANVSPEKCFSYVKKFTTKGSVIVFHDNVKATQNIKYALPATLEYFTKTGFSFKAITSEILDY